MESKLRKWPLPAEKPAGGGAGMPALAGRHGCDIQLNPFAPSWTPPGEEQPSLSARRPKGEVSTEEECSKELSDGVLRGGVHLSRSSTGLERGRQQADGLRRDTTPAEYVDRRTRARVLARHPGVALCYGRSAQAGSGEVGCVVSCGVGAADRREPPSPKRPMREIGCSGGLDGCVRGARWTAAR